MESFNCRISGCSNPGRFLCKNNQLALCDFHKSAEGLCQYEEIDVSGYPISTKLSFFSSQASSEECILGHFNEEGYLFKLSVVDIPLPEDYLKTVLGLCRIFAAEVMKLNPGEDEKIEEEFKSFLASLKQVIYNSEVYSDKLKSSVCSAIDNYNSKISDENITQINRFLEQAKLFFNMKETTRKSYISLRASILAEEQQRFSQEYITEKIIDINSFKERFTDLLSYFIQEENKDFSHAFSEFENRLNKSKENLRKKCEQELCSYLYSYLSTEVKYCRAAVFARKITDNFTIVSHKVPWTMICCLVLQKTEFYIGKPIDISLTEILIPLHMKNSSFVICYSENTLPFLAQIYNFQSFIIVSGSITRKIFIIKNKDILATEYSLSNFRLEKKAERPLKSKIEEKITSILYIQDEAEEQFVYIVNNLEIYNTNFRSDKRSSLATARENGKISSCAYYKEKKIICVKSEKALTLYSLKMVCLRVIKVIGSQITTISSSQETGCILLLKDTRLVEILIGENSNLRKSNSEIKNCVFSMSKDLVKMSCSKYREVLNREFKIPDEFQNISQHVVNGGGALVPERIKFIQTDLDYSTVNSGYISAPVDHKNYKNNHSPSVALSPPHVFQPYPPVNGYSPSQNYLKNCYVSNSSELESHSLSPAPQLMHFSSPEYRSPILSDTANREVRQMQFSPIVKEGKLQISPNKEFSDPPPIPIAKLNPPDILNIPSFSTGHLNGFSAHLVSNLKPSVMPESPQNLTGSEIPNPVL